MQFVLYSSRRIGEVPCGRQCGALSFFFGDTHFVAGLKMSLAQRGCIPKLRPPLLLLGAAMQLIRTALLYCLSNVKGEYG